MSQTLIPRHVASTIGEALESSRAVLVVGPRQSGKSTLNRSVAAALRGSVERRLDDAPTLERALRDPGRFVRHDGLMVIDEVQRAPELLLAIKQEVDLDPRPGRFLLSGSSNVLATASTRDSLAGRLDIVELHPFTQGEIERQPDGLVERLIGPRFEPDSSGGSDDLEGYLLRASRGGYPAAVRVGDRARARFFASYLQTLLERDARDISRIRDPTRLATVLQVLADRHAQPLSVESAARDAALPRSTFDDHLALLERLYLIRFLPALADSATKRAIKQRKLLISDPALAAWIAGIDLVSADPDAPFVGSTIEGFVLTELLRQTSWLDPRIRLSHYRSKDGAEVDAIIEAPGRRIIGIEVKATETPRASDFRHLEHLRRTIGSRFLRGIVLHAGQTVASYGSDLWALPISALWTTARAESPRSFHDLG